MTYCWIEITVPTFDLIKTLEPPYFIQTLAPNYVKEGAAVAISCHIGGRQEIKVSWFKGNSKVHASATCKMEYSSGIAYLQISKTTKSDTGEYTCTAENSIGSASCICYIRDKGDLNFSLWFRLKNPLEVLEILAWKTELIQIIKNNIVSHRPTTLCDKDEGPLYCCGKEIETWMHIHWKSQDVCYLV